MSHDARNNAPGLPYPSSFTHHHTTAPRTRTRPLQHSSHAHPSPRASPPRSHAHRLEDRPPSLPRSIRAEDAKRSVRALPPTVHGPPHAYELPPAPHLAGSAVSMSEHSAKRQRLDSTGRFSPASPPFDVVAKASHTKTLIQPRTPTSPPPSSMSSQANGGPAMDNTAAPSDRSPLASTAMSQSLAQSASSASIPNPVATPVSTTGVFSSATVDSDGDAMMEDGAEDDAVRLGDHRHSNHNRQARPAFSAEGGLKAAEGVSGDKQLFRVAESRCDVSRPHGSQNLFKLYGLESLARSVARTDPVTGEKINKLRKSYEGHIKAMQIAGKPKALKMEGVFSLPASYPPDYFQQQFVQGKEIERALNPEGTALTAQFGDTLDLAFAGMAPGPLPTTDANRYRTYIGTDDIIKAKPQDGPPHRPAPHPSNAPTPGNPAAGRGVSRPERSGSKRHYTDAAFQGYGEGYNDDFGADSTGGEDNAQGNMAKRRKLQFERTAHSVEVGGARR